MMYNDYICVSCGMMYNGVSIRCPFCHGYDTIRPIDKYEDAKAGRVFCYCFM